MQAGSYGGSLSNRLTTDTDSHEHSPKLYCRLALCLPFNTEGMYRGWIGADGVPHVAVFDDEALPLPGE